MLRRSPFRYGNGTGAVESTGSRLTVKAPNSDKHVNSSYNSASSATCSNLQVVRIMEMNCHDV